MSFAFFLVLNKCEITVSSTSELVQSPILSIFLCPKAYDTYRPSLSLPVRATQAGSSSSTTSFIVAVFSIPVLRVLRLPSEHDRMRVKV